MPIGHSARIWHSELGCTAFPIIIRLQLDDQQQECLQDCGRCEIASPDGTQIAKLNWPNDGSHWLANNGPMKFTGWYTRLAYHRVAIE